MKKIILFLALAMLLPAFALADVDLSGMSYDELVSLSKQVGMAIMQSDEFDSVTVPMGLWEVGVDIPEGTWIITPEDGLSIVVYGSNIDESGNDMNQFSRGNTSADLSSGDSWKVIAKSGNYFCIRYGNVIFTSDTGSSGLGFKKK